MLVRNLGSTLWKSESVNCRFSKCCFTIAAKKLTKKAFKTTVRWNGFCNYCKNTLHLARKRTQKHYKHDCFGELFCSHVGQDGSVELEKLKNDSRWGQRRKINSKNLGPAFSLCRRAGLDDASVRAQFFSQVHPPLRIELNKDSKL